MITSAYYRVLAFSSAGKVCAERLFDDLDSAQLFCENEMALYEPASRYEITKLIRVYVRPNTFTREDVA